MTNLVVNNDKFGHHSETTKLVDEQMTINIYLQTLNCKNYL